MMSKPIVRIHNVTTDEVIDREMTDDEYAAYLAQKLKDDEYAKTLETEANAKAALLTKLNISADEAKLLLS